MYETMAVCIFPGANSQLSTPLGDLKATVHFRVKCHTNPGEVRLCIVLPWLHTYILYIYIYIYIHVCMCVWTYTQICRVYGSICVYVSCLYVCISIFMYVCMQPKLLLAKKSHAALLVLLLHGFVSVYVHISPSRAKNKCISVIHAWGFTICTCTLVYVQTWWRDNVHIHIYAHPKYSGTRTQ